MQISSRSLLLLTLIAPAACSDPQADTQVLAKVEQNQREEAADDGTIPCATRGATTLSPVCTVDRAQEGERLVLIVRHPDGGFRRLLVTDDGRGVAAADGAEQAQVALVDGQEIEVRLGGDVYRLPATVRTGSANTR